MWNLRDILSILFKRKLVVIVFFLTVVIGTLAVLKVTPPSYAAVAKVLVKVGREDVYVPTLPTEAFTRPLMSLIRKEQLNSEVEIITSEYLAELLIEDMTPTGIYPAMFIKHPWYTPKGIMQGIIGIYNWLDGYFAPFTANLTPEQRVMKRLLGKDLKVEGTGDSNVIEIKVYNKVPDLAAKTANRLLDLYLKERGRIHSGYEGQVFEEQMAENEARLEEAQQKLKDFREANNLQDVSQERENVFARMNEIRTIIVDLKGQPSAAQRLAKWKAELANIEGQLGTLSDMELEYVRLMQDVEILKRSREVFLEKLEEIRINDAMNQARVGNVSVISRAVVPNTPASPKLWMYLAAILAVGVVGGIGLALLQEFLDDTIETDRDVARHLQVPVLGKIPQGR